MTTAPGRAAALDLELALVLSAVVALNLPQLASRVVPIHDTFYNFANFQIFYSDFFLRGGLASWFPYGTFGLQSTYEQLIALSPFGYLVGGVGVLLRVPDALLLFKISVVAEQIAFVYGVYLLSRRLFPTRTTALVLGLSAAATTVWFSQQWWDLRIYYLLPLVLYFLVGWLEDARTERLWLAGITGVAWGIGGLPYWIPLWISLLLLIVAVSARNYRRLAASLLTPSRANLLALAAFLAVAACYGYLLLHAADHAVVDVANRDPLTGKVDEENFRRYGGSGNLVIVANTLLFGWPLHLPWGSMVDNSVYVGLLPLLGLVLALARERSRFFLALMAAAVVLAWFSLGGALARMAYYLPGFSYYRHVALVYGLVKVLLLLASGYGIERLWALRLPRVSHPLLLLLGAAFAIELIAALPGLRGEGFTHWLQLQWGSHVLVRLAGYGAAIAIGSASSWSLRRALVIGLTLDLALYQLVVYKIEIPKLPPNELGLLEAARVAGLPYQDERRERPVDPSDPRTHTPENERSQRAIDLANRYQPPMYVYWYVYPFARFDPCRSQYRADIYAAGVRHLLALERGEGLDLGPILGCHAPKLRLASDATLVASADEARRALVAAVRSGDRLPAVIQLADGAAPPSPAPAGPGPPRNQAAGSAGHIEVTRFAPGELRAEVDVDAPAGAWLLYADAYHPGWRASVNGRETPISQANLAFKAVRVPPGASEVRFWFDPGSGAVLRYALAAFGAVWALGLLVAVGVSLLRGSRPEGA